MQSAVIRVNGLLEEADLRDFSVDVDGADGCVDENRRQRVVSRKTHQQEEARKTSSWLDGDELFAVLRHSYPDNTVGVGVAPGELLQILQTNLTTDHKGSETRTLMIVNADGLSARTRRVGSARRPRMGHIGLCWLLYLKAVMAMAMMERRSHLTSKRRDAIG
jgi:hypothetical protein